MLNARLKQVFDKLTRYREEMSIAITNLGVEVPIDANFQTIVDSLLQVKGGGSGLEVHYGATEPIEASEGSIWIPSLEEHQVVLFKFNSQALPERANEGTLIGRYSLLDVERYPLVDIGGLFECRMFNFSYYINGNWTVLEGFVKRGGAWIRVYNLEPFTGMSITIRPNLIASVPNLIVDTAMTRIKSTPKHLHINIGFIGNIPTVNAPIVKI